MPVALPGIVGGGLRQGTTARHVVLGSELPSGTEPVEICSSRATQAHPFGASCRPAMVPVIRIRSPGKIGSFIRKDSDPIRADVPAQSVMYRPNQPAWVGVLRKMSAVPLRSVAKT